MKKINLILQSYSVFLIIILFQINTAYSRDDSIKVFSDSVTIDDKHPQDFPLNSGFVIKDRKGNYYLRIVGSVRLNGAFDFNGLQSAETFATYEIPVGDDNTNDPRFFFGAYQSRFGIEIFKPTELGNVFAKIEADFQGSKNNLRLREAYAVVRNFLLGKSWSVFGDPESIPKTVDKDGPNSSVTERAVQIRFEPPQNNLLRYAVAIEVSNPDFTDSDSIEITPFYQSFPDVTGRLKYESSKWGHIQLASIIRSITVRNVNEELSLLAGYGGLLSGKIKIFDNDNINYQFVGGKGISSYIQALSGTGLDAVFDNNENKYVLMVAYGGFASYSRQWNSFISMGITGGLTYVYNRDFQPDDAFKYSTYFSLNSFLHFKEVIKIGVEYSFGKRVNKNLEYGNANRISFKSIVDF